ncbi:hypothetical protein B0A49_02181, partial [Cryomyces minteri]
MPDNSSSRRKWRPALSSEPLIPALSADINKQSKQHVFQHKLQSQLYEAFTSARGGPATKTPRTRNVLGDRRNPPGKPEFTPLLKSATRNRLMGRDQKGKDDGVPQTPAFLKPGYTSNTPSLPVDSSAVMYGEHTGSSADLEDQGTPAPPAPSSSAMSTPIAMPKRKGEGLLNDGNMMSLKEQEA